LIGAADFVREAIGQSVHIDSTTTSWQTVHGLKRRGILRVGVGANVEIGDIAACTTGVDEVKEMEMRIAWV